MSSTRVARRLSRESFPLPLALTTSCVHVAPPPRGHLEAYPITQLPTEQPDPQSPLSMLFEGILADYDAGRPDSMFPYSPVSELSFSGAHASQWSSSLPRTPPEAGECRTRVLSQTLARVKSGGWEDSVLFSRIGALSPAPTHALPSTPARSSREKPLRAEPAPARPPRPDHCRESLEDLGTMQRVSLRSVRRSPREYLRLPPTSPGRGGMTASGRVGVLPSSRIASGAAEVESPTKTSIGRNVPSPIVTPTRRPRERSQPAAVQPPRLARGRESTLSIATFVSALEAPEPIELLDDEPRYPGHLTPPTCSSWAFHPHAAVGLPGRTAQEGKVGLFRKISLTLRGAARRTTTEGEEGLPLLRQESASSAAVQQSTPRAAALTRGCSPSPPAVQTTRGPPSAATLTRRPSAPVAPHASQPTGRPSASASTVPPHRSPAPPSTTTTRPSIATRARSTSQPSGVGRKVSFSRANPPPSASGLGSASTDASVRSCETSLGRKLSFSRANPPPSASGLGVGQGCASSVVAPSTKSGGGLLARITSRSTIVHAAKPPAPSAHRWILTRKGTVASGCSEQKGGDGAELARKASRKAIVDGTRRAAVKKVTFGRVVV